MSINLDRFLHDAQDSVEHATSIEAFFHQFQAIKSLLSSSQPWLPESYFASRFVYGLQEEFQIFLLRFQPMSIQAAYRLALIYEESLYLHSFPESPMQNDELLGENHVEDTKQLVHRVDKVCEGIMIEDFSSESNSDDTSTWSNQGQEAAADTLVDDSAVSYHSQGIPGVLLIAADQHMDSISSNVVHSPHISPSEGVHMDSLVVYVHLPVFTDFNEDGEPVCKSPGPQDIHNNELELLVLREPKMHPPDMVTTLVDSSWFPDIYVMIHNNIGKHQHMSSFMDSMVDQGNRVVEIIRKDYPLDYLKLDVVNYVGAQFFSVFTIYLYFHGLKGLQFSAAKLLRLNFGVSNLRYTRTAIRSVICFDPGGVFAPCISQNDRAGWRNVAATPVWVTRQFAGKEILRTFQWRRDKYGYFGYAQRMLHGGTLGFFGVANCMDCDSLGANYGAKR